MGTGRAREALPEEKQLDDLVAAARRGEPRAVARLISLVEAGSPKLPPIMAALAPYAGAAHVVGITGPPGVGKSTLTSALVRALRRTHARVGVIAVDPSSPLSGGALLGDRVRMSEHTLDPGVSIRSMAARGQLGGLAWAAPQAVRVLDAAGCEVVLVETVGVGQSEVDIAELADSTLVLVAPASGDRIQAAKAGVLEIGDVYAVTKADTEGAEAVLRDLTAMVTRTPRRPGSWVPPVLATVGTTGSGATEVVAALEAHRDQLDLSGDLEARRLRRARAEIEAVAVRALRGRWATHAEGAELDRLARAVVAGETHAYAAAEVLLAAPLG